NDIDVYLSHLINDMKTLWKPGVEMYDAYMKEKFHLHAMIFCTINDFPAYNNLSGYSTKGKQACPICEDETSSQWLDNCKKNRVHGPSKIASNLMGLLLNIARKTKDGINARKDMVLWGIRLELAPVEIDKKSTFLPPACYTMSKAEKTQFCKCLHGIKVPSSYSANIKSLLWDDSRRLTLWEIEQVALLTLNEFYRVVVVPLNTTALQ
nr:hypothetical protein [Tanacetum cinerariifolium]